MANIYEVPSIEEWADLWIKAYPDKGVTKQKIINSIKYSINNGNTANNCLCTMKTLLSVNIDIVSSPKIYYYSIFKLKSGVSYSSNLIASVNSVLPDFTLITTECPGDFCYYEDCPEDICNSNICDDCVGECDMEEPDEPWDPSA